ncbi:unknown [Spodoptera litura nucleopolyhedrovirus II]|uniref:hypothetical protein n=1 Tax=Spodoptera litura nucleopolyhedrovirus II TaxID=566270 RepID=UPI000187461A|nr:hypothetical protein SlnV2_gp126 [Spodoptera litura nucleopolyhedrovirus II]ACI47494.1 unknown [Spodoptera litura nucleopolyhedrovirus II]
MFAFEYPLSGDSVSVYFDLKKFYFDYYELMNLVDANADAVQKKGSDKIIERMKEIKFLRPHQAIVLLDCFFYTEDIQDYILGVVYPVLMKYKKSLIL